MLSSHAALTSIAGFPMLRRKGLQLSCFKQGQDVPTHCPHTQYKGVQGRPWLWPARMGWKPGQRPNKIALLSECRSAREQRQYPVFSLYPAYLGMPPPKAFSSRHSPWMNNEDFRYFSPAHVADSARQKHSRWYCPKGDLAVTHRLSL